MTFTGMQFIDLFLNSLDLKYKSGERVIDDRNAEIIRAYFDFETNCFPDYSAVGATFELTKERIRHIILKFIRKIGLAVRRTNHPSMIEFNRLLKSIRETNGTESVDYKIYCFWDEHLNELPVFKIHLLISLLIFPGRKKTPSRLAIKKWQREKNEAEKQELRRISLNNRNEQLLSEKQTSLLEKVIWFGDTRKWVNVDKEKYQPKRKPVGKLDSISGEIQSVKCNRFIQYESGLELDFILKLESFPRVEWFLEQPDTLYYTKSSKELRYTPDFAVMLDTKEMFIVEIKPLVNMLDCRVQNKIEQLIDYCKEHGFGLLLTDGTRTINDLFDKIYDRELEKELLEKVNESGDRTILLKEIQELLHSYNTGMSAILPIILKNNLEFCPYPFKLTNRNSNYKFRQFLIAEKFK